MYTQILLFILLLLSFISQQTYTQGCSDAGFCTLHSLTPQNNDPFEDNNNRFAVGISNGRADNSITVYSGYVEYGRIINAAIRSDVKLSFISLHGTRTGTSGLADIFLSSAYSFGEINTVTVGLKIPLDDGNTKINGLSLPMNYQSSLGTLDLLVGFGSKIEEIAITVALQQPLLQNRNQFSVDNYPIDSDFRKFTSTNNYKRKGDILLRFSYPISLDSKIILTPSILPIYHFANDSYTTTGGIDKIISGSKGTTVNMNFYLTYSLNSSDRLEISFGSPLYTRTVRPDGLTRSYVLTMEYQMLF
ncbi:MAG TPA: hypothetical protein DCQ28_13575 [Bacteroidetes bacterium]|nr:hypothetical protein [Bacteroidota bacterium]